MITSRPLQTLSAHIDQHGLGASLAFLAELCELNAAYLLLELNDPAGAQLWKRAGAAVQQCCGKINKLGL